MIGLVVCVATRFGLADASFDEPALPEARGQALSFVGTASLSLSSRLDVGMRVPLTAASVRQPAGSFVDEAAWGNPQAYAAWRSFETDLGRGFTARQRIELAVGAPVAEHDASFLPDRALRIADATSGFFEADLWTPRVVPVTGAVSEIVERGPLRMDLELRVPVLLGKGVRPSLRADAAWSAGRYVTFSAGAGASASPLHASFFPSVRFVPSAQTSVALSGVVPLGGTSFGVVLTTAARF